MDKIYLQMYSFNDGSDYDTKACLKAAAEMGFAGVELFGPNFEIPAPEMKAYLDELGLDPISMHVPCTDSVEQMIPYAETLGMSFIGIGMESMFNEEQVHAFAGRLNDLGKICQEHGLTLTYHNHTQEFVTYGTRTVMDILMEETNPEYVSFELDAGWCAAAGVDPMEFLKKYAGRVKLIHIKESDQVLGPEEPKDYSKLPKDENGKPIWTEEMKQEFAKKQQMNCPAGAGLVDWKKLCALADTLGCQAYIVERELTLHETRLETLKADISYYRENI